MPFTETVTDLLTAHLLGDFVLQPNWLVKAKGNTWWGLLLHVAIVLVISVLLLGNFSWQLLAVIGASHLILDAIKVFLLPKLHTFLVKTKQRQEETLQGQEPSMTLDALQNLTGLVEPNGSWPFVIDQLAHFTFIVVFAGFWPDLFKDGLWEKYLPITPDYDVSNWYMGAMVLLSGFILCVPAGGILIGKITNGMIHDDDDDEDDDEGEHGDDDGDVAEAEDEEVAADADDEDATATAIKKAATAIETAAAAYTNALSADSSSTTTDESLSEQDEAKIEHIFRGLPDGGRYIGWLERILVMLFVLSGYPQGIGFLIAAKSILRFGDIKNWHQRAATEYVIIGTFMSFVWAMVIAGLTQQALQIWFPPEPPTPTVITLPSDDAAPITGGAATSTDPNAATNATGTANAADKGTNTTTNNSDTNNSNNGTNNNDANNPANDNNDNGANDGTGNDSGGQDNGDIDKSSTDAKKAP